ncbi:MAG TPA: hypothetical protein VHU82_10630 [Vicinamibacterales bacterium]|nr:hypothetical protein [Vicinamibacterales bacterium]
MAQSHDGATGPATDASATTTTSAAASSTPAEQPAAATSPLAIHIGDADLLIGGFMDATAVMRSTNTGNGLGTNFSSFPFTTTATGAPNATGNLSETRFSTQNSRLSLQATSKVGGASLKGYLEADFLGNTAQNLNITSNANTLRMRLYWAQYQQGKFEFLAGQSWSMMTPNRNGLSPMPGDIFYGQDVDTNYQMGLIWGRTTQFRFIAHATDAVTAGVSLENPQQYTGSAVVLPTGFAAAQVDTGSGGSAVGSSSPVPNMYPDVIGKIAFDPKTGKTHQHIDAAVLVSGFKTFNPANSSTSTDTGTAESLNVVLEPVRNLKVIATNFFSKGGGRYIANTNIPDFIVNPDFSLTPVNSWSGIYGAEVTAAKTLLYGYYSIAQVDRTVTVDANGTTPIGYGLAGSQTANHKIQEATVGITQTFFRDPKIGAMQLMVQFSNVQRTPFSVPAGTPSSAKLNMLYVNVRYVLP